MPQTLNDVPQSGQTLAFTQPLIRSNFTTIDAAFQVDHVAYVGADQGKHNQVTFPIHAGSEPATVNEVYLFNKNATPSNVPDIWVKKGAAASYPLTSSGTNGLMVDPAYWSYLPSGFLIQWGHSRCGTSGTVTVFPLSFASAGAVLSVTLTQVPASSGDNAFHAPRLSSDGGAAISSTQFRAQADAANTTFYWVAIGAK